MGDIRGWEIGEGEGGGNIQYLWGRDILFIIIEQYSKEMAAFFKFHQLEPSENYGEQLFTLSHKYYCFSDEFSPSLNSPPSNFKNNSNSPTCLPTTPAIEEDFEKNFLYEHLFILKKYIKKYRELFPNQLEQTENSVDLISSFPKPRLLENLLDKLEEGREKNTEGKEEYAEFGLMGCQKVKQLLETLLQEYSEEVSLPLLQMSLAVWLEYQRIRHRRLAERDIVDYSCRILKKSFMKELKNALPVRGEGEKLKSFALVLVNTLLFAASGYFVNPYYQLEEQLTAKEFIDYEIFLYDSSSFNCFEGDESEEESEGDEEYGSRPRKMVKHESTISDTP